MVDFQAIANQLLGREIYVVRRSEGVPDNAVAPGKYGGCFHRRLDLAFRDWLTARGRWVGRRPCVFVNDTIALSPLAILLHELAHAVDAGIHESDADDRIGPSERLLVRTLALPGSVTGMVGNDPISQIQHGASFVRSLCHLWYRAMQLGYRCSSQDTYFGEYYSLPDIDDSICALINEPQALERLSVFDISQITPPKPFRTLWEPYS